MEAFSSGPIHCGLNHAAHQGTCWIKFFPFHRFANKNLFLFKLVLCSPTFLTFITFLFLPSLDVKGRNVQSPQFLRFAIVPGYQLGTYSDWRKQKMKFSNLDTKKKRKQETFTWKILISVQVPAELCFLYGLVCSWDKILSFLSTSKVHKNLARSNLSTTGSPALFARKRKTISCHSSCSLAHTFGKDRSLKKLCSSNSTWYPLAIKQVMGGR